MKKRLLPPVFLALAVFAVLPLVAQEGAEPSSGGATESGAAAPAGAAADADSSATSEVVVLRLAMPIHVVAVELLDDAVREAEAADAAALVVELDTPGGQVTSMREMIQTILGSRVPVVVYIAPSGAQAASAGFFLLMAADVAAMAPGTNAGAAATVGPQGEDIEGTMGKKIEQDSLAQMRAIAKRRGRNIELAEEAVSEARSFDADEALEAGLIDLISPSLTALLADIDGTAVDGPGDTRTVLATRNASIRRVEPSAVQRFLALLAHPNIAYLLLSIGSIGIMVELYNPGAIFPGVIGAIALILGFFAMSVLPVNAAGLALLGLAVIFFIAEIKVTSYGLLSVAGVVCLVIGSLMLFKSPDPALRVSLEVIAAAAISTLLVVLFLMFQVLRAHRTQVRTGLEGMVHEHGRAQTPLAPAGKVFVHGEIWDAVAELPPGSAIDRGIPVEVTAVEGMRLRVRALEPAAPGELAGPAGVPPVGLPPGEPGGSRPGLA